MTDAIRTTTFETLIKRVAFRLGDLVMVAATEASPNTSTLIDEINIPTGNEDLTRRQLFFTSGDYRSQFGVITGFDPTAHSITYTPVTSSNVVMGTTACIINKRGMGYVYEEYRFAIQQAQEDAYPIARVPVAGAGAAFDSDVGTISIPSTIDEVYEVQYQDENGFWVPISAASFSGYRGWQVNEFDNTITINDYDLRDSLAGYTVRVLGEGREAPLVTFDDVTYLHPDYVVATACYHLALMGMERDITGTRARQVGQFEAEMERKRILIRTLRNPGSRSARSS